MREFKESFPDHVVSIDPGDTGSVISSLLRQKIDLALAIEPENEPQLEFKPLFTDELRFVVDAMHPWARAGRVAREEIARQNYILYRKNSVTFRLIERYFLEEKIVLNTVMELGTMEGIKELVKLGLGVSILAPWIARRELREGSLVELPLGRRRLERRWGIVHWRSRRLSLAEETFIGLCASAAENLLHPGPPAPPDALVA
jgi:DNA-binding transcriptional LysR family regulator